MEEEKLFNEAAAAASRENKIEETCKAREIAKLQSTRSSMNRPTTTTTHQHDEFGVRRRRKNCTNANIYKPSSGLSLCSFVYFCRSFCKKRSGFRSVSARFSSLYRNSDIPNIRKIFRSNTEPVSLSTRENIFIFLLPQDEGDKMIMNERQKRTERNRTEIKIKLNTFS